MPHTAEVIERAVKEFISKSERENVGAIVDPAFLAQIIFKELEQYGVSFTEITLALKTTGELVRVAERFAVLTEDWPNTVTMTAAQKDAVYRLWSREKTDGKKETFEHFRERVGPGPGCVMVHARGCWLGIEPDGHTHS